MQPVGPDESNVTEFRANTWVASTPIVGLLHSPGPPCDCLHFLVHVRTRSQRSARMRWIPAHVVQHDAIRETFGRLTQGIAEVGHPAQRIAPSVSRAHRRTVAKALAAHSPSHVGRKCVAFGRGRATTPKRTLSRLQLIGWRGRGGADGQCERTFSGHTSQPWKKSFSPVQPNWSPPASPQCSARHRDPKMAGSTLELASFQAGASDDVARPGGGDPSAHRPGAP